MASVTYLQPQTMETTFYHDESGLNKDAVKKLKNNMTLDFNLGKKKEPKFTPLLSSPDLNMLKLASPDLERLIIQQNGHVTTTPTPSSGGYPPCPTEEQEAYARGFVDALQELHQKQGIALPTSQIGGTSISLSIPATVVSSMSTSVLPSSTPSVGGFSSSSSNAMVTTTLLPGSVIQYPSQNQPEPMHTSRSDSPLYNGHTEATKNVQVPQIKEELPQTVPCMSPINMQNQERIKLERKRARNRVAARKCRTRKLERISRLESRVSDLKGQNTELQSTAKTLRDQVCKLKQQIMDHMNNGCQLVVSQSLLS